MSDEDEDVSVAESASHLSHDYTNIPGSNPRKSTHNPQSADASAKTGKTTEANPRSPLHPEDKNVASSPTNSPAVDADVQMRMRLQSFNVHDDMANDRNSTFIRRPPSAVVEEPATESAYGFVICFVGMMLTNFAYFLYDSFLYFLSRQPKL